MSSLDHYRAKAKELKARSQSEDSAISKAVFEELAESYVRLAHLEESHQREVRQKARAQSRQRDRLVLRMRTFDFIV